MHHDKIQEYMKEVFQLYKEILNSNCCQKFWDLVALTTYDQDQKKSFERQLEKFLDAKIFKDKLYVVADPPNKKLGCGGSTLHVLKTLYEHFGSDLYNKKILIIHSGGCSQRLPSYSLQGKIFSPVPIKELSSGNRVSQMLDLKLAMYLPFCQLLRPGIFVTCGDDIETYYLDTHKISFETLNKADVVALAHPCDLQTATGHGVYILPIESASKEDSVFVSDCIEVLQKPSVALMKEKKALVKNKGVGEGQEMVYSDSVFWMSENAYRPLLNWYCSTTLESELDAYSHFMLCLGLNMKEKQLDQFDDYRSNLLPILKDLDFKLIVLNDSKFYHIGTMKEYLDNFTICSAFKDELNLEKISANLKQPFDFEEPNKTNLIISSYFVNEKQIKINTNVKLIIEWCKLEMKIDILGDLILSNCTVKKCPEIKYMDTISFMGNFLYHTVPLRNSMYVTVAFEISADLKQSVSDISFITIASIPLIKIIEQCNLDKCRVLSNGKPYSLWNLKIFTGSTRPDKSFWRTHNFINTILNIKDGISIQTEFSDNESHLFSMKDVLELKDLDTFLSDRNKLLDLITITDSATTNIV